LWLPLRYSTFCWLEDDADDLVFCDAERLYMLPCEGLLDAGWLLDAFTVFCWRVPLPLIWLTLAIFLL
jgi:hypothetical protein